VAIPRDFAAEDGFASSDSPESCVGVDLPVSLRSDPLGADRRNPLESPRLSAGWSPWQRKRRPTTYTGASSCENHCAARHVRTGDHAERQDRGRASIASGRCYRPCFREL